MDLKEKIEAAIKPICENNGFYLLDVKIKGDLRHLIIQVFADNEKGITIDDCAFLSRRIQDELDMDTSLSMNYRLDVSSPGIEHPLQYDWEFKKNLGRSLVVKYFKDPDKLWRVTGKLLDFNPEQIVLETKQGILEIKRDDIKQAKVKLQW